MKSNRFPTHSTLALAVLIASALTGAAIAQVKNGKSRPAKTSHLMKGVVKPHCGKVKESLDAGLKDDKAWEELAVNASVLNEISFTLMDDNRCPDGVWADAVTKQLRQGSADLLKAAEARDAAAAKAAFGLLAKSCKSCHDKHKEK